MTIFIKLRDDYVKWHANRIKIPKFQSSRVVRQKVTFSGRVEAELQGEELQISFLIQCIQALKRASVKKLTILDLPVNEDEEGFTIVR